jgi:hypothetical protein
VAQADIQAGLVSYYHLDEESGTVAADSSGNGHSGTLVGASLEWLPGYDGGAVSFLGSEGAARVEIPTTGMSATAGTVSLFGYLTDPQPSTSPYFFGHTTHQPEWTNRIQLYMDGGPSLDIGLGDTHTRATDVAPLKMKTWYHIVLTWNNGSYFVYVDGKEVAKGSYTGLTTLDTVANIGNDGSLAPYESFGGRLDEVRIYNRAVSADEVKQLFQLPATPRIKAWAPSPADGARDVMMALLSWKSLDTVKLHNIYLGTDPNLTAKDLVGSRRPGNLFFCGPWVQPGVTYYWRVDEIGPDMKTVYQGNVWGFLMKPPTAYDPSPADGVNTASPATELKWLAGTGAATHHVYFAESLDAVTQGAPEADKGVFTDPNFSPGELQPGMTYFWRVDEIGLADAVQTGPVWSFTTVVPVDDFESYTDDVGSRIFQTWIDGWGYSEPAPGNPGNGSGASVGHDIWTAGTTYTTIAETTIVHGGKQSMPLDYNNVNSPYYSEADRTFATTQDWTADGVDTLVLYVQAKAGNAAGLLYVTLKDASNRTATVVCPNAKIVTTTKWTEWKVSLADFAGVSLNRIKAISIGVGDRANPAADGVGLLYVDDIGLAKPSPAKQ